jgi:hypothetical protein
MGYGGEHWHGYLFHPEILYKDKPLSEFEGSGFHIRQDEVTIRYSLSIPDTMPLGQESDITLVFYTLL